MKRIERLKKAISAGIFGKPQTIEFLLTALIAKGHLLIEDVPGVGKTTLALTLSKTIGCQFKRIQFTSDMLPSDILGASIYDVESGSFRYTPGPLFANIVLADEINRSSPKTQSALLEAMQHSQVSIDGHVHELPHPFMVIATQNPIEHFGTFPLPESQLDRFIMCISIGYPEQRFEKKILRGNVELQNQLKEASAVVDIADILDLQQLVEKVTVKETLVDYLLKIIQATREAKTLSLGVSTRGAIAYYKAVQAYALLQGRDYVIPDDIKYLAKPVLAHRISINHAEMTGPDTYEQRNQVVDTLLESIDIPL